YVFSQLMSLIHRQAFARIVEKYNGNDRIRTFSCRPQFLCMSFGQLPMKYAITAYIRIWHANAVTPIGNA
ncbi:MAG: DUF4372 domain-containing protein, partial [Saprospiraceae bacterium]